MLNLLKRLGFKDTMEKETVFIRKDSSGEIIMNREERDKLLNQLLMWKRLDDLTTYVFGRVKYILFFLLAIFLTWIYTYQIHPPQNAVPAAESNATTVIVESQNN